MGRHSDGFSYMIDTEESHGDRRYNGYRFDKSINLGNVLTILALVVTILAAAYKVSARLDAMEFKVDMMWQHYDLKLKP